MRVHVSFDPIESRSDFDRTGKPSEFNITIDRRAAPAAKLGAKVTERDVIHLCTFLVFGAPKLADFLPLSEST